MQDTPALTFHVLIAAAGNGSRLGGEIPKQYQTIDGQSILLRTIKAFLACENLETLHVLIHPDHHDLYQNSIKSIENDPRLKQKINGSNSRKKSIFNGLKELNNLKNEDIILIHDAARPFISEQNIQDIVSAAHKNKAASLYAPLSDTIKKLSGNKILETLDRETLGAFQTPQGFHYGLIKNAHEQFENNNNFTDDVALLEHLGQQVIPIKGSKLNFKITTQEDMQMAQSIIQASNRTETRTGQGYDVHAFEPQENKEGTIRLGGIDIPHNKKLKGHSDADVALHTITDALYGALSLGDIGQHFPPSNNDFKNMDSAIFLEHATNLVKEQDARITQIDLTIICEAPKIGPHVQVMRERIADIMQIPPSRISVKATTTERLGFTGRKEGIAATATATCEVPYSDK